MLTSPLCLGASASRRPLFPTALTPPRRSSRRLRPQAVTHRRLAVRATANQVSDCRQITVTNLAASDGSVSYTHLRAHETRHDLVCRLLLEKKKKKKQIKG